jgi:hypothetical protein
MQLHPAALHAGNGACLLCTTLGGCAAPHQSHTCIVPSVAATPTACQRGELCCVLHLYAWAPAAGAAPRLGPVRGGCRRGHSPACSKVLQHVRVLRKLCRLIYSRARMASNPRGLDVVADETAVVCFWDLLHDFCNSGSVPDDWRQLLQPGSAFLHVTEVDGPVVVNGGLD